MTHERTRLRVFVMAINVKYSLSILLSVYLCSLVEELDRSNVNLCNSFAVLPATVSTGTSVSRSTLDLHRPFQSTAHAICSSSTVCPVLSFRRS
jgi:hypothetical protein